MTVKDKPTIILDGRKFDWLDSEIVTFLELWNEYTKSSNDTIEIVKQIAKDMKEDSDDLLLLALHLGREGKLKNDKQYNLSWATN